MNLFLTTRHLTQLREDHLTEFFAAALALSSDLKERYAQIIFKDVFETIPTITSIETQVSYDEEGCRPDMRLNLSDGKTILCEHKLDAEETAGKDSDEKDQLERYLSLPVDGVVYVRSSWKEPQPQVLEHPKYIKPTNTDHFLWRDFYHIFDENDLFQKWMKEAFEHLGFTPPHPSIGDLNKNIEDQNNFAKFWDSTRNFAQELGWKVGTGSRTQLYLSPKEKTFPLLSDDSYNVFISPDKIDRFLIRVVPKQEQKKKVHDLLSKAAEKHPLKPEVVETKQQNKTPVVDINTSLFQILGKDELEAHEIEKRLFNYVTYFLKEIAD